MYSVLRQLDMNPICIPSSINENTINCTNLDIKKMGSSFYVFVLSYYVSFRSEFRVVVSVTISAYKRCSVRLYL